MKIEKSTTNTLQITRIPRAAVTEYFIHGSCAAAISETEVFEELFKYLSSHDAQPVLFRVFASEPIRQQLLHQHAQSLGQLACPVTWISQDHASHQVFGVQAHAFSGRAVEAVMYQDTCVGCRYTDDGADYLQLSFLPSDRAADNVSQARAAFETCRHILLEAGLDFEHVARTWLFTDDILSWYDKLNQARDAFFDRHVIFNKLVPASTGVGVSNFGGAKLLFEALAVRPGTAPVQIEKVDSPLQCSALDYRSSFSRAVHIRTGSHRRLLVSGTASIDEQGGTLFLGDTAKQIDKTMQVTEALLNNADMGWQDVVSGIMYFKDDAEFHLLDTWFQRHNRSIPHVKVHADICRDDLLFELELEAIVHER